MQIKFVFLKDWDIFTKCATTYIRTEWNNGSETFKFSHSDELFSDIKNIFVEILTAHLDVKEIDYKLEWKDEWFSESKCANKLVLKLDIDNDEDIRTLIKNVFVHLKETLKPHWPLEAWLEYGKFSEMPEKVIAYRHETIKEFIAKLENDFIEAKGIFKIGLFNMFNVAKMTIKTLQREYRILHPLNETLTMAILEEFLDFWEELYIYIEVELAKTLKPLKAIFKDDLCIGFTSLYKGIPTYVVSDLSLFKSPNQFQITQWPEKIKVATSHFLPFILKIPSNVIQGKSNQWIIFHGKSITTDLLPAWEG